MTSYQKLKWKCEKLQGQVELFKNALTCVTTKEPKIESRGDGTAILSFGVTILKNEIDYGRRLKLNEWVAENLDEETVLRLLKLKKELKNDK